MQVLKSLIHFRPSEQIANHCAKCANQSLFTDNCFTFAPFSLQKQFFHSRAKFFSSLDILESFFFRKRVIFLYRAYCANTEVNPFANAVAVFTLDSRHYLNTFHQPLWLHFTH